MNLEVDPVTLELDLSFQDCYDIAKGAGDATLLPPPVSDCDSRGD